MGKLVKWFLGISVLILAGLASIGLLAYGVLSGTLPNDNGTLKLAGLNEPVEVVFDANAVPHIEAANLDDAMHVLGFVHARDRLWQMEFLRRVGQGRLSEILGEATVDTDIFLRTLDMAGAARLSYEELQPETKRALVAYAKGVNAYQQRETRLFEPVRGAEFMILGHTPEPWEPWNSVLILKVMGFSLGKNLNSEIQRLALASRGMSPQEIDDILPYSPRDTPVPLPDLRKLYGFGENGKELEAASIPNSDFNDSASNAFILDFPIGRSASNNWVISGTNTASGKPILANDPHLGLTAPSAFYLAHVSFQYEGQAHNLIGGTLPGIPMFVAGRNANVAWGLTTANLDAQDLYIEKVNPENPEQYLTENGWREFSLEQIEIGISGGESRRLDRRVTRNGPVLPDAFRNLKKLLPQGHVASLRWNGLASDDTTLDTLMANMFARNVEEFLDGTKYAVSPMQAVVVGDVYGNIALTTPGRIPLRNPSNQLKGRAPVPGWLVQYQWTGFIESGDIPRIINPQRGALTTANANFLPAGYPHHITYDWAEHFRQARAEELVYAADKPHDVALSKAIMADSFSPPLFELVKLASQAEFAGAGEKGDIFNALVRWDGHMDKDRPEPIIMLAWFRHLHEAIYKDDFGEEYELFDRGRITRILRVLKQGTARDWCDKQGTEAMESCSQILTEAFDAAVSELKTMQGEEWRQWQYGKAHLGFSEHRPFGKVDPLNHLFNITVESSGGPYTLNRGQMYFGEEDPYLNRHAASYRAIYDFSDLNKSIFIQSSGQSGNPMSQHYRDFAKLWSQSKFVSMTTNKEAYSSGAKGTWIFKPQ